MDILHRLTNWLDHNRWTFISILLAAAAVAALVGCQPQTAGLLDDRPADPEQFETQVLAGRRQLQDEEGQLQAALARHNAKVEQFVARVEIGRADLQRQLEVRGEILNLLGAAATDAIAGAFDPRAFVIPALGLLGAAFGVGKSLDNRRKDQVIRRLKADGQPA
ncbi:MAG: hypothetical protein ACLFUJ_03030 [Phycisphaerae bacterium]